MNLNRINLNTIAKHFKIEQPIIAQGNKIQLFDPKTNKPKSNKEEPEFSEDICIIDENGVNGIAFFSFKEKKWIFYIDTLIDYNSEGAGIKWKWYYPPLNSNDIEW